MSEKGVSHIVKHIQKEITNMLGESGISKDEFIARGNIELDKYRCNTGEHITAFDTSEENYDVCIEQIKEDPGDELKRIVTFRSIGEANERTEEISTTISFSALAVPENLKYAIGTVNMGGTGSEGEGNVYLHGGVEIYGDIKVDNNLFTVDYGPGLQDPNANWRKTTLPALYPSPGYDEANIVLGGELIMFKDSVFNQPLTGSGNKTRQTNISFYNNHLNGSENYYRSATIDNMFANTESLPVIAEYETTMNDVSIDEEILKNKDFPVNEVKTIRNVYDMNTANAVEFEPLKNGDIVFSDNIHIKRVKVDRSGYRLHLKEGNFTFDKMYVNRDVFIGLKPGEEEGSLNDISNYKDVTIGGYDPSRGTQLYVDGNVTIRGVNLTSNLTIYATGTVTINYSTIQGKEFEPGREGSLIIFAKGPIQIKNNSLYIDQPSELKGFFYSEDALEMFGVGSNMKIHGGISAKRITLNAIRGNYDNNQRNWKYAINPTSLSSPSRLIIEYDTELIENYLKLNRPEEIVKELEAPKLIDRE